MDSYGFLWTSGPFVARGTAGEALGDDFLVKANSLKELSALGGTARSELRDPSRPRTVNFTCSCLKSNSITDLGMYSLFLKCVASTSNSLGGTAEIQLLYEKLESI